MSVFSTVVGWFKKVEVWVSAVLVKLFGQQAAQQFAAGAVAILKTEVGKIALAAVQAALTLTSDGAAKRAAAFAAIGTQAKASGIAVSDSLINLLIETALQAVKGNFGA